MRFRNLYRIARRIAKIARPRPVRPREIRFYLDPHDGEANAPRLEVAPRRGKTYMALPGTTVRWNGQEAVIRRVSGLSGVEYQQDD